MLFLDDARGQLRINVTSSERRYESALAGDWAYSRGKGTLDEECTVLVAGLALNRDQQTCRRLTCMLLETVTAAGLPGASSDGSYNPAWINLTQIRILR
ncbi:hypothetical protein BJV78DRAFT_1201547 [Lactifluus subvellereus]|nr:hypothetical protein BJV78DRAFT_1201547 [Lactifluus subvellereus]